MGYPRRGKVLVKQAKIQPNPEKGLIPPPPKKNNNNLEGQGITFSPTSFLLYFYNFT
jgi:hypothetical protein